MRPYVDHTLPHTLIYKILWLTLSCFNKNHSNIIYAIKKIMLNNYSNMILITKILKQSAKNFLQRPYYLPLGFIWYHATHAGDVTGRVWYTQQADWLLIVANYGALWGRSMGYHKRNTIRYHVHSLEWLIHYYSLQKNLFWLFSKLMIRRNVLCLESADIVILNRKTDVTLWNTTHFISCTHLSANSMSSSSRVSRANDANRPQAKSAAPEVGIQNWCFMKIVLPIGSGTMRQ
jgi:hypothetical protein